MRCVLQVKAEQQHPPPPPQRPACAAAAPLAAGIHLSGNGGEGASPFTGAPPERPGGACSDCQALDIPSAATPTASKNGAAEHGGALLHETEAPGGRSAWQPALDCQHPPVGSAGGLQGVGVGLPHR